MFSHVASGDHLFSWQGLLKEDGIDEKKLKLVIDDIELQKKKNCS